MTNAVKIYAHGTYLGGTISAVEAKAEGISTDGLMLASLEACKTQIAEGDIGSAYGGPIEVAEGFYEFDFGEVDYLPLRIEEVE